jgi:hypothetical protein
LKVAEEEIKFLMRGLGGQAHDKVWIWPEKKLVFRYWPAESFLLSEVLESKREYADFLVLHCWADVWFHRKPVVLSRLTSLLGKSKRVFARKTLFERSTASNLSDFMSLNHLHPTPPQRHNFALSLSGQTLAMASFSRPKKMLKNGKIVRSYEMIRFANVLNTNVIGGLSKLIEGFCRLYQPDDLVCYADRDWSDGRGYLALGFKELGQKPPQFFWLDPQSLTRYYPSEVQDPRGLLKIWNSGSLKYGLDFLPKPDLVKS